MKGILTIKKNEAEQFRVSAHYAKVNIDLSEDRGDELIFNISFSECNSLLKVGKYMQTITPEQIKKFIDAENALRSLNELRNEIE